MKVSEVFVETLAELGVKRVYGVTRRLAERAHGRHSRGTSRSNGCTYAMRRRQPSPPARKATSPGEIAVCAGSCGPGNLHLINGLYDCHRSRVPVLAIAAQIPSQEIGSGYFQETDPEHLFAGLQPLLRVGLASGPDAPRAGYRDAHRDCPARSCGGGDPRRRAPARVLRASAGARHSTTSASVVCPPIAELRQAAEVLNRAQKVTILGGAGCAGAHDELVALAAS